MDDDLQRRWAIARAIAENTIERTADVRTEQRAYGEPDAMQRWEAMRPKREPEKPQKLDTMPPEQQTDWEGWLAERLAQERQFVFDCVGAAVGQLLEAERQATTALANEVSDLRLEAAKLGNEISTLREALAVEHRRTLDLPPLPRSVN